MDFRLKKNGTPKMTKMATKKINLALQGGGSHGAFTWGAIDYLLADGRLEIEGISGTSSGAMNASVTAYGLSHGGAVGARQKLSEFWQQIALSNKWFLQPSTLDKMISHGNMDFSPYYQMYDYISKLMSPYELNPLNLNPLRDVLAKTIDFEHLLSPAATCKLFVAATNVKTGRLRVFTDQEISLDSVMASACLPFLFQAVEIEGEHYWDGGYIGNPPLFPLINETKSPDILIIQINANNINHLPTSARDILDRVNTLSFNSSLIRELRAVHFMTKLIDNGELSQSKHKRVFIHTIDANNIIKDLGFSSKLNTDLDFITYLYECGQQMAKEFLEQNFDQIGVASSTDIVEKFM